MNSRITISDELKALDSQLTPVSHPYTVPDGYFENLAESILARIRLQDMEHVSASEEIYELSPLLAGLNRKMPFEVPAGYFDNNAESASSIHKEEEESLVLSFISREMPYEVPLGYFAGFPEKMAARVGSSQGKVVVMRKWMKMAVAAAIAGIITISGLFYFNNNNGSSGENIAVEIENASTEELNEFLKNTTSVPPPATDIPVSEEARALLNDVSDQELEAFLSNIPVEELPATEEELELLYN